MSGDLAGWLWEVLDAREREAQALLDGAQRTIEELRDPRMLGKWAPGWGAWPDVKRFAEITLAEVEAARAILAEHEIQYPDEEWRYCRVCHDHSSHDAASAPCRTLRLLAQPHSWREEQRA